MTNQQIDIRGHREVTLPKIVIVFPKNAKEGRRGCEGGPIVQREWEGGAKGGVKGVQRGMQRRMRSKPTVKNHV